MKHGYGKLYDACGLYYDGHWQNDKKHGSGVIFNNIGIYYTGKWENDMKHGYGKLYDPCLKHTLWVSGNLIVKMVKVHYGMLLKS